MDNLDLMLKELRIRHWEEYREVADLGEMMEYEV
jgi:hypothetical protein